MERPSKTVFPLLMILISIDVAAVVVSAGVDSSSVIFESCSDLKFAANTAYEYALTTVLSSLSTSAGFSTYGNFTSTAAVPGGGSPVYGLYQCRPTASLSGCESCVRSAASFLTTSPSCAGSASATLQLRGCLLRYGNDSFMGRPESSLLRRACGPAAPTTGAGGGVGLGDVVGMREAALAGVVAGSGQYRAAGSGYVDAAAQCVGDLGGGKLCTDCVTAAAEQLRDGCGAALSGEVYLGKCYAQYAVRGAYTYAAANPGYVQGVGSHGNDHASQAGKDIAIIIGIVAAVLLLILFLNHLHKSREDTGK